MQASSRPVLDSMLSLSDEERKEVLTRGLQSLPQSAKEDVAVGAGLERPTGLWANILWLMIVASFCVILVGGGLILYFMSRDQQDTTVVVPIVTTVLGALVGLLAPSPVQQRSGEDRGKL